MLQTSKNTTRLVLSLTLWTSLIGCSGTPQAEIDLRQAASIFHGEGEAAFESKDYKTADEKYTAALQTKKLHLDFLVETRIKLAVCKTYLDNLDDARKLLDEVKDHRADSPALYHSANAFLLIKQGKNREANIEWRQAKRLNRKVERFGQ